jgi:hypothetical protein
MPNPLIFNNSFFHQGIPVDPSTSSVGVRTSSHDGPFRIEVCFSCGSQLESKIQVDLEIDPVCLRLNSGTCSVLRIIYIQALAFNTEHQGQTPLMLRHTNGQHAARVMVGCVSGPR